ACKRTRSLLTGNAPKNSREQFLTLHRQWSAGWPPWTAATNKRPTSVRRTITAHHPLSSSPDFTFPSQPDLRIPLFFLAFYILARTLLCKVTSLPGQCARSAQQDTLETLAICKEGCT